MSYAKEIEKLLDTHNSALWDIAIRIFNEVVIPFCDKHDLKFYVSWGMYSLAKKDDSENRDCWEESIPNTSSDECPYCANKDAPEGYQEVIDALWIPIGGSDFIYALLEGKHYRFVKE